MDRDAAIAPCTEHLVTIGEALTAYEHDHGKLPDQLSDLYPKYVADKAIFHCPADPSEEGDPARGFAHRDPKMKMSYAYECSVDESHGLPQPMGPFPRPDVGNAWGTCRLVAQRQAHFFGDRVPVVRCFHHKTEDSQAAKVLNLTRSGQVYQGHGVWEDSPGTFAAVLACVERDLMAGDKTFLDNWRIGPLDSYCDGRSDVAECIAAAKPRLAAVAERLESFAQRNAGSSERGEAKVTGAAASRVGIRLAARLRLADGNAQAALKDQARALALAAADGDYGPDRFRAEQPTGYSNRDIETDTLLLARIYRANHEPEQALAILVPLHMARHNISYFMEQLAEVHDELNAHAVAEQWRDKAEPARKLVGGPAPDFAAPAPDGSRAALADLLHGHKALLVDFFFVGCGPCRAQAPQLQELYAKLRDHGLQVVAIDMGDDPAAVQRYVEQFGLTHPVLLGGKATDDHDNLFNRYHVRGYPTTYLIDANGAIVWQSLGYEGEELPKLRAELQKMGITP
jgi:thiol-disulfide isomerase/thioredoxin